MCHQCGKRLRLKDLQLHLALHDNDSGGSDGPTTAAMGSSDNGSASQQQQQQQRQGSRDQQGYDHKKEKRGSVAATKGHTFVAHAPKDPVELARLRTQAWSRYGGILLLSVSVCVCTCVCVPLCLSLSLSVSLCLSVCLSLAFFLPPLSLLLSFFLSAFPPIASVLVHAQLLKIRAGFEDRVDQHQQQLEQLEQLEQFEQEAQEQAQAPTVEAASSVPAEVESHACVNELCNQQTTHALRVCRQCRHKVWGEIHSALPFPPSFSTCCEAKHTHTHMHTFCLLAG